MFNKKSKKEKEKVTENEHLAREDMKELLAEYFAGGVDEDEELAMSLGWEFAEIRRMREEFER